MTWARALATGNGALAFRLDIEGVPYEFVTDANMESTGDRPRTRGLLRDGLVLSEEVDIARAKVEASPINVTIIDYAGNATHAFGRTPQQVTWLDATATTAATTISVKSTSGFASPKFVHVGTECIEYTTAGASAFTTCTRGRWSTIAQTHYTRDGEYLGFPEVTDRPRTIEGRRAYLYAYGSGDNPIGDGTLIWRGICSTDARLVSGAKWQIKIDPITRLLAQDLGSDLDEEVTVRGIYYPWTAPLVIIFNEGTGADIGTVGASGAESPVEIIVRGFFESNATLAAQINSQINASAIFSTWDTTVQCEAIDDNGYKFHVTTGATAKYVTIRVVSCVDHGNSDGRLSDPSTFAAVDTVAATTTYNYGVTAPTPRGVAGDPGFTLIGAGVIDPFRHDIVDADYSATYPKWRYYLGGSIAVDANLTAAKVEWPTIGTLTHIITDRSATTRYVEGRPGTHPEGGPVESIIYSRGDGLPTFKFGRHYTTGSLTDFMTQVTTLAPTWANIGGVPFITTTDIELTGSSGTSITEVVDTTPDIQLTRARMYTQFAAKEFADVLAAECQLLGCFPRLNSSGKLTICKIKAPTATEATAYEIDASNTIVNAGFPQWERQSRGTINTIAFKTDYDPDEDRYRGPRVVVRDVTGFGMNKQPRTVEVKPAFGVRGEASVTSAADYVEIASGIFGLFGAGYAVASVDVPLSMFSVLCGDVVRLTNAQLPDETDGTRGFTTPRGALVIGRRWDLKQGRGTLDLLVTFSRFAGYTPSFKVVDQTNTAGDTWDIELSNASPYGSGLYAPDLVPSDFFAANDAVRVYKYDNATPAEVVGVVNSVSDIATSINVTFDSTWTPGGDTWILGFGVADYSGGLSTDQLAYAFMSGTDLRIDFASAVPARVLAP